MARPQTKEDLLTAASENFEKLQTLLAEMSDDKKKESFTFDISKEKAAHFTRDKNTRDVLIHLYAWLQLLIDAIDAQQSGKEHSFLPTPYNWRTYGEMNQEIWEKYQNTSEIEAETLLTGAHTKVMELLAEYSNEELFSKGFFDWTGTSTMGSYCVSATASHYDWALKKLRKHIKN